jgi:hypothetical protein
MQSGIVDSTQLIAEEVEKREEKSTETAQFAIRHKRRAPVKHVPLDSATELHNSDLNQWNRDYLETMRNAARHKDILKLAAIAKTNAEEWVLGSVLGMGRRGPLDMFSGARIIEAFTGIDLLAVRAKRPRETDPEDDTDQRRVRARSDPLNKEVGRSTDLKDQINAVLDEDDTIEYGRDAPTPLEDRRLSSLLPWNVSAGSRARSTSTHGRQPGGGGFFSRRGSRLISASPLQTHGAHPLYQHKFIDMQDGGEAFQLPMPDTLLTSGGGDDNYTGGEGESYELFGPAARVDTQTAGKSQWQLTALIGESANFLDFLRAAIESSASTGGQGDETMSSIPHAEDPAEDGKSVTFRTLLPPEENSTVVAAQAFLHVLSLGTRNFLRVKQVVDFGEMKLSVIEV